MAGREGHWLRVDVDERSQSGYEWGAALIDKVWGEATWDILELHTHFVLFNIGASNGGGAETTAAVTSTACV